MPRPSEHYTCLGCPIGCPLELEHEGREIVEVRGNRCKRGDKYARQEFTDPRRNLSTTVAISGGRYARLPVKITQPVEKHRVLEAAAAIHQLRVQAPVELGQVLLENLLGEPGISVVATRAMPREDSPAQ
jgi:CxxC motif-containing protein